MAYPKISLEGSSTLKKFYNTYFKIKRLIKASIEAQHKRWLGVTTKPKINFVRFIRSIQVKFAISSYF